MRHSTRRRNRSVESLFAEAAFTATHDITCRALRGVAFGLQLALAAAFVIGTVVHCLAAAAWESVNADDRRALRQGTAAAMRGCWWAARRLPAWVAVIVSTCAHTVGTSGQAAADRVYQAMRHEVARSQGWTREVPQDETPMGWPWEDWQDIGGEGRVAA